MYSSSTYKVPFLRPPFGIEERYAAYKCMFGNEISVGQEIQLLEKDFLDYTGSKGSAYSVCNGSIGLDFIWQAYLRSGHLKRGDKVLLPSYTFVSVPNSIVNAGLVPVFADIDKANWNIDVLSYFVKKEKDEKKGYVYCSAAENDVKAIIFIHTFGNPCNCEQIKYLQELGYLVIEDCCEAAGAEYKGKKVGSFGHCAVFSFNATKNMTCGEGGLVIVNDEELDPEYLHMMRENGFGYSSRNAQLPGYNWRLDNIHAAIALQQLKGLNKRNKKRKINARKIVDALEWDDDMFQAVNGDHVYQIFGILVEDRDKVYEHMIKAGVEVKKYFSPHIAEQDYYAKNFVHPNYPNTDYVSDHIICLPFDDKLSSKEIGIMVNALKEVI